MNKKIQFLICCLFLSLTATRSYATDNTPDNPTYIIGHWNYPANSVNPVYVISDGADVELFINGISTGHGRHESNHLFIFDNVIFQPGTLTAVSYDSDGKEHSSYTLNSSGVPAQLKLTVVPSAAANEPLDSEDMTIQCEVTDFYGKRCLADDRLVLLEIEEPADWSNASVTLPQTKIYKKQLNLHKGENCFSIKKPSTPGEIKITAKAMGLSPASISF